MPAPRGVPAAPAGAGRSAATGPELAEAAAAGSIVLARGGLQQPSTGPRTAPLPAARRASRPPVDEQAQATPAWRPGSAAPSSY